MRRLGSLIMRAGDENQVPAGGALAVDRDGFSAAVTAALESHPLVTLERGEVIPLDEWDSVIVATGPLTSPDLASAIAGLTGQQQLAFFDAIAPIVHRDSIDLGQAWFQSRYDKSGPGGSGADYINCPLSREQYHAFVAALLAGDKTSFHEWETNTPYFDGCLPIEIMAERGIETLRHGPMKPFGLTNPHQPDNRPYAVVQLRQDNKLGTLFNMVGFQTKLKHAEQVRTFRTIPGLENAEFARLGGLHRNTFLNSPVLLDEVLRLKANKRWRFAGQITGCEGYVESAAVGLLAGRFAAAERRGEPHLLATADDSARRTARPYYRWAYRDDRCGPFIVPADERQLRFVSTVKRGSDVRSPQQIGRSTAKALARKSALSRRALADLGHWISGASPRPQPNDRYAPILWKDLAARQIRHCRRQGDTTGGRNGS
jgi:methylenetetrahydrofolate--tRNA-(uracil-5-)-methyltransferase